MSCCIKGSSLDLMTWNDMNEPAVFNGPENSIHRHALHFDNTEHRDVHNLYGMMFHKSSYDGHLKRSNGKLRPFVLSRSFFAGSQRYGEYESHFFKFSLEFSFGITFVL